MGLNSTPLANRIHIGFFGCRNAGKSSLVNAVTNQQLSIVSETKGTTTDPVFKTMELLPLGPVVIIDTPGYDDEGSLGEMRINKTKQVLNKTDIAVLVVDSAKGLSSYDNELILLFEKKEIKYIIAYSKADLLTTKKNTNQNEIFVSTVDGYGIIELKERIGALNLSDASAFNFVGDLIRPTDFVVLVCPIDSAAPKGRLILPQQQAIRDILDAGGAAIVVKEFELKETLKNLGKKPSLVITDSQVFALVAEVTPESIPLTSFSILMARYKGFLETAVKGVGAITNLCDGDTILIAEGCTHHRQCDDIGTVKIPRWLKGYTGKNINIKTVSGTEFPEDLTDYKLIIHCGGCMLNEREVKSRMNSAKSQGIPFTNFGILIAYMQGILKRSLSVLPQFADEI